MAAHTLCQGNNRYLVERIMEKVAWPMQALERGDPSTALRVLQRELGALKIGWEQRLHALAGCLLCTTGEALRQHVGWFGTEDNRNREQLLRDLQAPSSLVQLSSGAPPPPPPS